MTPNDIFREYTPHQKMVIDEGIRRVYELLEDVEENLRLFILTGALSDFIGYQPLKLQRLLKIYVAGIIEGEDAK